jgi:quercetin dioxygenase-like cupin family protein
MIVLTYAELPHKLRPDGAEMTDFFPNAKGLAGGEGVLMGFAVFPPGIEAPLATHAQDEYAFVLSGTVKARIGGEVFTASAGAVTYIPAGEAHISFNDGDVESCVVWMLVDKR